MAAKPGKDFNFSADEFSKLQRRMQSVIASDQATQTTEASAAIRDILIGRYKAYQAKGLGGIPPYTRSAKKRISIGDELRMTTETLEPVELLFPDYYKVLTDYPDGAGCCEHEFRWLKTRIRKRPTFALSHLIIQQSDQHLLVTERFYYVGSTVNGTQISVGWFPYRGDTYMGLAMSASSDILDSFLGKLLRPVGRSKARDMVSEVLLDIKKDLESGSGNQQ